MRLRRRQARCTGPYRTADAARLRHEQHALARLGHARLERRLPERPQLLRRPGRDLPRDRRQRRHDRPRHRRRRALLVHRLNAYQIQLADSLCHAAGCADPDGAPRCRDRTAVPDASPVTSRARAARSSTRSSPRTTRRWPGSSTVRCTSWSTGPRGELPARGDRRAARRSSSRTAATPAARTLPGPGRQPHAAAQCATQAPYPPCLQNLVLDISPGSRHAAPRRRRRRRGARRRADRRRDRDGVVVRLVGRRDQRQRRHRQRERPPDHDQHDRLERRHPGRPHPVTTMNDGRVAGYAANGGGGLVAIGTPTTTPTRTSRRRSTISTGAQLLATFDVTVNAGAAIVSTVRASGGARRARRGHPRERELVLKHTTKTIVRARSPPAPTCLSRRDDRSTPTANASSQGGGLGVDADATARRSSSRRP